MAVVLAYRVGVAVALNPTVQRAVYWDKAAPIGTAIGKVMYDRIVDADESDEDLSAALSEALGYSATVATFTGTFETRRVQLEFSLSNAALVDEDVRVITFHHIKLSGGTPTGTWDAGDFSDLNAAYDAFWAAIKGWYPTLLKLTSIKYYRAGPQLEPPQPPAHVATRDVAGTSGASSLPPQVALSVTEKAGSKKNWGRFYLPAPAILGPSSAAVVAASGRPATAFTTAIADAADTLYEAGLTAELPFVVYRATLAAGREHKGSGTLAERPANAQTVDELQIDDVFDVIRSRRYEQPTLRTLRAIG